MVRLYLRLAEEFKIDMFGQNSQLGRLEGLWGVGAGFASFTGWIVAFVIVLVLAGLAWWTMHPTKRAASDEHGANLTRAKQTRKTR